MTRAMAQETATEQDQAPARRRRRRGVELAGLALGIAAGTGIALAWLVPGRDASEQASSPVLVQGATTQATTRPDPAKLDAEWLAYSDRSDCADWAGGDGVSALRLNSGQLAWFFSDTSIGPAGPAIGLSQLSGFAHNSLVIQTSTGPGSTFVTMTGGGACTGPGGPGNAAPVVGPPPAVPGGPSDRYWDEDGLVTGGTVVKFYDHYRPGLQPYVAVGSVMATFPVRQLSEAGHGSRYGAVARPHLITLPSYTPPGGPRGRRTPVLWGAALLQEGNTVYVYGTQSPNISVPGSRLYLARVPVSQLTDFAAWQFYQAPGHWSADQHNARPVQPRDENGETLGVSSGFSVIRAGGRYWLIQASPLAGTADIDAYPAAAPWGPFDAAAGRLLYRDPAIGLDAAHEYRIMYEARVEPALSTPTTLVISYNTNSEAVTAGCVPMAQFTNTVILPRFVTVPLTAFRTAANPIATAAPSDYPPIVQQDPSQWFDAWQYPGDCPPVPRVISLQASTAPGKVTLSWPDAGLDIRYRVYLTGPGQAELKTVSAPAAVITGLPPGTYQAKVVPVNYYLRAGPAAEVTFTIAP
jgi:hypothetical protein